MHRMWNWKMIILKCLVITLGVFLAGLGCASYLKAALGSDPVTAFVEGLVRGWMFCWALRLRFGHGRWCWWWARWQLALGWVCISRPNWVRALLTA